MDEIGLREYKRKRVEDGFGYNKDADYQCAVVLIKFFYDYKEAGCMAGILSRRFKFDR